MGGESRLRGLTIDAEEAKSVIVVDLHNVAWRAAYIYSNIPFKSLPPSASPVVFGLARMVLAALKYVQPPVLLVFALDDRPQLRRRYFSYYKANRKPVTARAVENPIPAALEFAYGVPSWVVRSEGNEADDVVASVVTQHFLKHDACLVVSNDHDLYQLLEYKNVLILAGKKLVDRWEAQEQFDGLERPYYIAHYKAVLGDVSDNVPPIRPRLRRARVVEVINCYPYSVFRGLRTELHFSDYELREYVLRLRLLFQLRRGLPLQIDIVKTYRDPVQSLSFSEEVLDAVGRRSEEAKKFALRHLSVWA